MHNNSIQSLLIQIIDYKQWFLDGPRTQGPEIIGFQQGWQVWRFVIPAWRVLNIPVSRFPREWTGEWWMEISMDMYFRQSSVVKNIEMETMKGGSLNARGHNRTSSIRLINLFILDRTGFNLRSSLSNLFYFISIIPTLRYVLYVSIPSKSWQ